MWIAVNVGWILHVAILLLLKEGGGESMGGGAM